MRSISLSITASRSLAHLVSVSHLPIVLSDRRAESADSVARRTSETSTGACTESRPSAPHNPTSESSASGLGDLRPSGLPLPSSECLDHPESLLTSVPRHERRHVHPLRLLQTRTLSSTNKLFGGASSAMHNVRGIELRDSRRARNSLQHAPRLHDHFNHCRVEFLLAIVCGRLLFGNWVFHDVVTLP